MLHWTYIFFFLFFPKQEKQDERLEDEMESDRRLFLRGTENQTGRLCWFSRDVALNCRHLVK